jgi:hypothetical protein
MRYTAYEIAHVPAKTLHRAKTYAYVMAELQMFGANRACHLLVTGNASDFEKDFPTARKVKLVRRSKGWYQCLGYFDTPESASVGGVYVVSRIKSVSGVDTRAIAGLSEAKNLIQGKWSEILDAVPSLKETM